MLAKSAIEVVHPPVTPGYYSSTFLVPNKSGGPWIDIIGLVPVMAITSLQSDTTGHQSDMTGHQSVMTGLRAPVTGHQSPGTGLYIACYLSRQNPQLRVRIQLWLRKGN